jgi:hypothetical protein
VLAVSMLTICGIGAEGCMVCSVRTQVANKC